MCTAALPASEPFCFHTTSLLPARSSSAYPAFSRARLRDWVVVIVLVHFSFAGFNSARFCSSFLSFSRRLSCFSCSFASLLKLRAIAALTFLSTDMRRLAGLHFANSRERGCGGYPADG